MIRHMEEGVCHVAEWVRDLIEDRKAGRIEDSVFDRILDAAVPSAIRLKEKYG